ncbi:MAG: hypothetical protein BECKG1743D_GA0114223_112632 [Candidatus Kentron sp. G]|nr:MAG: hypothetical protein BECKG1743F_GA0114225_111952 [Candidatus Kentron sp. G]VFN07292.1 MAG: hypothetical protein BECKG1743E_GA0114224_111772 [Candidatus Kentron sp. G]VFN08061.1 MAG: hypothetical protein BECKG1743D_GA0114223_112632 [Candidatus Kentron sp. G]
MPGELNNLKKFLIFVPVAAGVSLIHVDRFLDGSLDEHVRQIFTARMSTSAVKFRQLQKPQFSLQELQAVLVPSVDKMHGFDVEYAAKRAVPIDGEALDRLFALPKPPKPPRKVVPTVKIKRPNLVPYSILICGYRRLSLMRALSEVNCQLTPH